MQTATEDPDCVPRGTSAARRILLEAARSQGFVKMSETVREEPLLAADIRLIFPILLGDLDTHARHLDEAIAERRREMEALGKRAADLRSRASRAVGASGRAGRRQAAEALRSGTRKCEHCPLEGAP